MLFSFVGRTSASVLDLQVQLVALSNKAGVERRLRVWRPALQHNTRIAPLDAGKLLRVSAPR